VPSTFEENLRIHDFPEVHEYPVATATHKAVEVYERLVVRTLWTRFFGKVTLPPSVLKQNQPNDPPDLVIAGRLNPSSPK